MDDLTQSSPQTAVAATDADVQAPKKPSRRQEREDVAKWHERVSISKKASDQWATDSGALRFIKEYKGKYELYFQSTKGPLVIPPINDVFAYVQSDVASTYFRDPYITVMPKKTGTAKGAYIREQWLNYKWRELKTKEEIEYEIIDKDLVGFAFHKVGMAFQSIGTGEQLKIQDEKLYSMRIDWRDVFWNIGAKRPPYDCQWMAQRIVRPLDDIKAKYGKRAAKLEGTQHPDLARDQYEKAVYKDDIKVGVLYEIWDARDKMIYTIAEGLPDQWLDEPRPWPDYLDEFPFLMYWDFVVPGEARPMSAIAPQEPQILEKTIILAQAVNHVKRWNRQLFVLQGLIPSEALDKFERGDDGAIIEVPVKDDINKGMRFADFGQLPTDFYLIMDRLDAVIRSTSGQPEFERGGTTKGTTRTVKELMLMRAGSKSRTDRRVDRLETHLENIARHMMANLEANFDLEEVVKITGEPPEEIIKAFEDKFDPVSQTITFTPEDIKGEYDIEVKAGSTLPMDKESRMSALETILTTVAPIVAKGAATSPFMQELVLEILRDYGIKGLEGAFAQEEQAAEASTQHQMEIENMEKADTAASTHQKESKANLQDAETMQIEMEMGTPMDEKVKFAEAMAEAEAKAKPPPKPVVRK